MLRNERSIFCVFQLKIQWQSWANTVVKPSWRKYLQDGLSSTSGKNFVL